MAPRSRKSRRQARTPQVRAQVLAARRHAAEILSKRKRETYRDRAMVAKVKALKALKAQKSLALAPPLQTQIAPDVYDSLEAAEDALQARQREDKALGIGTGLAIGLGVVAVLGVGLVVAYLLFRRRADGSLGEPVAPNVIERHFVREVPVRQLEAKSKSPKYYSDSEEDHDEVYGSMDMTSVGRDTTMRTFTLPSIQTTNPAIRIATSPHTLRSRVTVRVVAPVGGFAVIAFSPGELNMLSASNIPAGDTLVMPAGDQQDFHLPPKQVIYAKGSITGVVVSVIQGEDVR